MRSTIICPIDIVEPEQFEDIINMINDMGIAVHESPPDLDTRITDNTDVPDEDAAAEAAGGAGQPGKRVRPHQ